MSPQDDDKDLFRKLYGDIDRVVHERHEQPATKKPKPKPRRPQAESARPESPYKLSPYPRQEQTPDSDSAEHSYRANGVQNSVIQKLRRGKMTPEMVLDLHGMTREQALDSLQVFIQDCLQQKLRCVQIIHGKGYRSEAGRPVLKPAVAHWLKQMSDVLAFCPSLPRDGGEGAIYVLLKSNRQDATL